MTGRRVNGSAPGSHSQRRAPTATIRVSYNGVAERLSAIRLLSGSTASSDATCSCAPCSAATTARSNRRVCARPSERLDRGDPAATDRDARLSSRGIALLRGRCHPEVPLRQCAATQERLIGLPSGVMSTAQADRTRSFVQRTIKLDRAHGAIRRQQQHEHRRDIVIEPTLIKPHHKATVRPLAPSLIRLVRAYPRGAKHRTRGPSLRRNDQYLATLAVTSWLASEALDRRPLPGTITVRRNPGARRRRPGARSTQTVRELAYPKRADARPTGNVDNDQLGIQALRERACSRIGMGRWSWL